MSGIVGKFTTSAVAATVENTFALSNMSFDFSLVKVEPPAELKPFGNILSETRRQKAEYGSAHILARRLGALFEGLIEPTPNLLQAYCTRASEIALATPVKSADTFGIFAGQAGFDGTTIWATATSGKSVLRLHLLACMLARLWTAQEATAIWVEVVTERQNILKKEAEDEGGLNNAAQAAAQIPIEESQLSDWDCSARSWLRLADQAKNLQQTQLKLIVDNLDIPINAGNGSVYDSVISIWRQAMISLDSLVAGSGQSVESGAVLLGLSSLHLYPDMIVLGEKTVEIRQKDSLVRPGGLVTIGLSNATDDDNQVADGIFWSMPLSSLHYYGDPVPVCRSSMRDSTRLSLPQLQQVALGATMGIWPEFPLDSLDMGFFIISLWELLRGYESKLLDLKQKEQRVDFANNKYNNSWSIEKEQKYNKKKRHIGACAQVVGGLIAGSMEFTTEPSQQNQKFVRFGKRKCSNWLCSETEARSIPPLFGLALPEIFVPMIRDADERVRVLRHICEAHGIQESSDIIIRYKFPYETALSKGIWEYTLPKKPSSGRKRDHGGNMLDKKESRFIRAYELPYLENKRYMEDRKAATNEIYGYIPLNEKWSFEDEVYDLKWEHTIDWELQISDDEEAAVYAKPLNHPDVEYHFVFLLGTQKQQQSIKNNQQKPAVDQVRATI